MKRFFVLLPLLLTACLSAKAAGPFYVATNGLDSAAGDIAHPWSHNRGAASTTNANVILWEDGTYPRLIVASGPATIRSLNKWRAVITSPINSDPAGIGIQFDSSVHSHNVTVDGFKIRDTGADGVSASGTLMCVFTNLWITNYAMFTDPHDGINSSSGSSNIIAHCLIEWGHMNLGGKNGTGHAIYVGGSNNIVDGNVIHDCSGYAIHFFEGLPNTLLWDNRIYNNFETNTWYGLAMWGAVNIDGSFPGTNSVYGNTFLSGANVKWGTLNLSNNIILPGGQSGVPVFNDGSHPATIHEDYNLSTAAIFGGVNDVLTTRSAIAWNSPQFMRYWLTIPSSPRNAARSTVFAPYDFFGAAQSSVTDIGFNQYSPAYATDARTYLYPSGSFPDFWAILSNTVSPSITVQPSSVTIAAGGNAGFTVSALGSPPLVYQWTLGNTPIAGANSFNYATNGVALAANGSQYRVIITNSFGSVTSSVATLTVTNAPVVITAQPQSKTILAGNNASFTVTATGSPLLSYQWLLGGSPLAGATTSAYTTNSVPFGASGSAYSVVVTNLSGAVTSSTATLTVTNTPVIPTNLVTLQINGRVIFSGNVQLH